MSWGVLHLHHFIQKEKASREQVQVGTADNTSRQQLAEALAMGTQ